MKALNDKVLSKLDKTAKEGFLHPHFVETDKIKFPIKRKSESSKALIKKKKSDDELKIETKMKHKFQFF